MSEHATDETRDPAPDSYEDLMVEAIRPALVRPGEVVLGFQVWDMDDFSNERTLLFRVRDYREVERLGAYPRLMRALFAVDGRAFAVGYRGVEEILAGGTRLMELPIRGACALSGRAADDLIAIGDGVARFDGSAWRKLDAADGEELLCVARHGDVFYAAGKRGRVADRR